MKKVGMTLTIQLVIIVSAILLIGDMLMGIILMKQSQNSIKTIINGRMLDIANTAAAMLDGDIMEKLTAEDAGSEEYESQMKNLRAFQDSIELKYIYCINDEGNKHFTFSIDPTVEDPGEFGSDIVYTDALYQASLGVPSVDEVPYEDQWGTFYSAYSPVFNSKGEVATIVAVDFSAQWYEEQISRLARTILIFVITSAFIGAVLVIIAMGGVRKSVHDISREITDLEKDVDDITKEIAATVQGDHPLFAQAENELSGQAERLSQSSVCESATEDTKIDKGNVHAGDSSNQRSGVEYDIREMGEKIHAVHSSIRDYLDHTQRRANNMITALASDYRSVYYVSLDRDEGICFRSHSNLEDGLDEGEQFVFSEVFTNYANDYVAEKYRQGFLDFIKPENIRKKLESERIIAYRYLVVRDGKESYEMLRMAGVRRAEDRYDHIIHSVGVGFTDVDTEMRQSLDQRRALSDALAAAEQASKAKTAFLSSMSHEIRTPMNAIIGLDRIALSDPGISDKTRDYLEQIGSSANHLLKIINDILDMSRIESGRMMIKHEEFSFKKLLSQINTIIGSQCSDKGIQYNCEIKGEVDNYYIGDDMKLKQVIINILGNAVKFTEPGGNVSLLVERIARYDRNSTLKFIMKDNGIGMDENFIPRLFDAFSQEDSSNTNKYGSTGLGMAITKNIIEMMNGRIEVESKKGVGTEFTVTVTLMESDRKDTNEVEGNINPNELSVLIIDDDKISSEHARLELEKLGLEAEIAGSGPEAIEMVRLRHARRESYNMILVDWKMSQMDGIETTRKIREIIGDDSAIIILTGYQWEDDPDEAANAGVDSFISKPLNSAFVMEQFKQVLVQKNMQSSAGIKKAPLEGRHILLAEDILVNAKIMMKVLSMKSISVDHAENGKIAVEMFETHPEWYYDAILMDMRMPEMDGLTATAMIRALDRSDAKKIPIIALTANAFDEDVQRSLQAGLNAHLSKPVEPDVIFDTLESLITDDR
ncbi:response regulator [Butyrivibrio sp. JL13D10]|uniref:response regulator n=1 Tax=Butyrivibrio sp. JL13D10 TaxID=3236815 RepID=UPI0038B667E9